MDAYRRFINRDLPTEERACTSKVTHETRAEARSVARRARRSSGSALHPYRCPYGEHWHVGHAMRRYRLLEPGFEPAARPGPRLTDALGWMSPEWWSARRQRHFHPGRDDRPWRDAWVAGTAG